ncbi:glycosyltransferase family 4 protein [Roseibium hamelinense]|nr:glycosyltransferase family 4 protein [Roseibium hamelinense]
MHFSKTGATSIDLVARDLVLRSRFQADTCVVGGLVENPFPDVNFIPVPPKAIAKNAAIILQRECPDLVVVHQHAESASFIARRLPHLPVVLHRHGLMRHKRGLLSRWRKGRALKHLSAAIFVSDYIRSSFLAAYPQNNLPTFVVPNGVDGVSWEPSETKEKTIVYVGRAREDKGVIHLLDAFLRAKPDTWRLHLVLAVQTQDERRIFEKITGKACSHTGVVIEKNLDFTQVQRALGRASIAALPSIVAEGFPRAVVEAMACKCAIITTPTGGTPEAAGDTVHYLPMPGAPDFLQQIAAALQLVMEDIDYRKKLASAARERFEAQIEIGRVAKRYDDVLETILKTRTADTRQPENTR